MLNETPSHVFVSFAGENTATVYCDIETDLCTCVDDVRYTPFPLVWRPP